jgi:hypothetical protein
VNPFEFTFFAVLVVALLGLAGYILVRQHQTRRLLQQPGGVPEEDREHLRRQVRRRTVSAVLMVLLAGMLVGYFFLHASYKELEDQIDGRAGQPDAPAVPPEHKAFVRFFAGYWATALFVLLGILFLAVIDFWAIARHGLRSHRRLQADHRDKLRAELERYRQRRGNGEV